MRTPAGTRTSHTMVTPWAVSGALPAEVLRDGAPATDTLTMGTPIGVKDDDPSFRECRNRSDRTTGHDAEGAGGDGTYG